MPEALPTSPYPEQPTALQTAFSDELVHLGAFNLDAHGLGALADLRERGFEVFTGFRPEDWSEVNRIASQQGVQEFCPNDLRTRFGSEDMARKWLEKQRLFFTLRKIGQTGLVGYGWTGPEESKQEGLQDGQNTFAVRLGKEVAGQGLARFFTEAIISGSMALGMRNIWLETWQSNVAAWKSYEKAGAELVSSKPGNRLTITHIGNRIRRKQVPDTRRFMKFTRSFTA